MSTIIKKQYTEIFCPKKIQDMILLPRIRKMFGEAEISMHELFFSGPGTGKSTLCKLIGKEYEHCLYINVPREGSVENLRDGGDIHSFCSEMAISMEEGKKVGKILIMDEINQASPQFFEALKGFMDSFPQVKILATTNHLERIPEAIRSRFHCADFDPVDIEEEHYLFTEYGKRLKLVAKITKSEFESDAVVAHMLKINFPDFRSLFQKMQELSISDIKMIKMSDVSARSYEFKELFDFILKGDLTNVEAIHTLLSADYNNKPMEVLYATGDSLCEYIKSTKRNYIQMIPNCIQKSAYWSAKALMLKDQAMAMKACVFELITAASRINAPAA